MNRFMLYKRFGWLVVLVGCLPFLGCPGNVEICENEVRIGGIGSCNGSVVTAEPAALFRSDRAVDIDRART